MKSVWNGAGTSGHSKILTEKYTECRAVVEAMKSRKRGAAIYRGNMYSLIEMDRFEKNVDRFEEKAGMIEKAVDNAVDRVTSTAKEMMLRAAEKTEETDDKNI